MSKKLYEESSIQDIADAIRKKNGTENSYKVSDMSEAILDLPTISVNIQPLSVTKNGTYSPPSGVNGYAPVVVNVSGGGGSSHTKLMTHGQVSTDSDYATTTFDSEIDFSLYDYFLVIMNDADILSYGATGGAGHFNMPKSNSSSSYYTLALTSTTIGTTYYNGSYRNLYVDVYGVKF